MLRLETSIPANELGNQLSERSLAVIKLVARGDVCTAYVGEIPLCPEGFVDCRLVTDFSQDPESGSLQATAQCGPRCEVPLRHALGTCVSLLCVDVRPIDTSKHENDGPVTGG